VAGLLREKSTVGWWLISQANRAIADIYNQFLERADQGEEYDDEEKIAAAEIVWGKDNFLILTFFKNYF
jgi:hypothetical protein